MTLTESISRAALQMTEAARDALLGISTYTRPPKASPLTLEDIDARRDDIGGGLLPPPSYTPTRWYLADLEAAERLADMGDLRRAGQLMNAARKDGHLAGVLSTRTGGLVRLPRQFRGDAEIIAELERGHDSTRSAFDEMCPPSELALLASDGVLLGVGVGELLPVRGRRFPVLVRYDPQFLRYNWAENRWYYSSIHGLLPITPGDGHWVLHTPGGRVAPWQAGLWRAVGQAWIRKQHAGLYRDSWEAKLAHPARVATAPQGASETQKQAYFKQVMAWGVNTVFGLTPGYEVELLESNGRGWESFTKTIEQCNEEFKLAIAGQSVTSDGGSGFINGDLFKSIRTDLIKETADGLSYTSNTQIIPTYIMCTRGADAVLKLRVIQEYDVTPPKDRNSEATAMTAVAAAVKQLTEALAPSNLTPNVRQLVDRFGIPVIVEASDDDIIPDESLDAGQIKSLLDIVTACAAGQIPREAAVAIISSAFDIDTATAESMLGPIGAGFVPAAPPPAALPPGAPPAPADPAPADAQTQAVGAARSKKKFRGYRYESEQKRVPKGDPAGGQFTGDGGSSGDGEDTDKTHKPYEHTGKHPKDLSPAEFDKPQENPAVKPFAAGCEEINLDQSDYYQERLTKFAKHLESNPNATVDDLLRAAYPDSQKKAADWANTWRMSSNAALEDIREGMTSEDHWLHDNYAATQAVLRAQLPELQKQGVVDADGYVTLYRGIKQTVSGNQAQELRDAFAANNDTAKLETRELSSWTTQPSVGRRFTGGDGVIVTQKIHYSRMFTTHLTQGTGVKKDYEHEWVPFNLDGTPPVVHKHYDTRD